MKRSSLAIGMLTFAIAVASAQDRPLRPTEIRQADASWAAHEALTKLQSDGLQGLIGEIKQCYTSTAKPAYRCVYLDGAASNIDSSTASAMGLSVSYTDEFLSPNAGLHIPGSSSK